MLNRLLSPRANDRREGRISPFETDSSSFGMLPRDFFVKFLCLERKRTERSGRRFVLLLVDCSDLVSSVKEPVLPRVVSAVMQATRDTDVMGWYREGEIIGVVFTEVGPGVEKIVVQALSVKVQNCLYAGLSIRDINKIRLSFHLFPEDWDDYGEELPVRTTLQLGLAYESIQRKMSLALKRSMDIVGSILALIFCLPLFVGIALAIKLTSRGPVFFRQVRLGQYGRRFTFVKFRSMYVNSDHTLHEEYVKQFIRGAIAGDGAVPKKSPVYKLTADPRITSVGRFLRSTSLDELPQFMNVLVGDMSLVGPRPPVSYEFENYDLWHRRRLLAVKPGITGLWQVNGRSRVRFDEMVRLDIRYARSWSLWMDIQILLRTPRAVLSGNGAY